MICQLLWIFWGFDILFLFMSFYLKLGILLCLEFVLTLSKWGATWRIIPVSKWLITMVGKSPKGSVCSPSKWP